jgi:short-subunit dehydrogenase
MEGLTADLATEEGLALVSRRMDELSEIVLLVNNAGIATAGNFVGAFLDREIREIRVNVEVLVSLTHHVLGGMIKRRQGGVINLASVVGFQPFPQFAVYAATKAFVISFTEALDIDFDIFCPNPNCALNSGSSWTEATPAQTNRPACPRLHTPMSKCLCAWRQC